MSEAKRKNRYWNQNTQAFIITKCKEVYRTNNFTFIACICQISSIFLFMPATLQIQLWMKLIYNGNGCFQVYRTFDFRTCISFSCVGSWLWLSLCMLFPFRIARSHRLDEINQSTWLRKKVERFALWSIEKSIEPFQFLWNPFNENLNINTLPTETLSEKKKNTVRDKH